MSPIDLPSLSDYEPQVPYTLGAFLSAAIFAPHMPARPVIFSSAEVQAFCKKITRCFYAVLAASAQGVQCRHYQMDLTNGNFWETNNNANNE